LTGAAHAVDNTGVNVACRIKPIAPSTLVALALVMSVGAPVMAMPQPTAATVEHTRVVRQDGDDEQVARLIAAINAAAHKHHPRTSHAADLSLPPTLAAAIRMPWPAPPTPSAAPPAATTDGRLHLIDLPPPAPSA